MCNTNYMLLCHGDTVCGIQLSLLGNACCVYYVTMCLSFDILA